MKMTRKQAIRYLNFLEVNALFHSDKLTVLQAKIYFDILNIFTHA